MLRQVVGKDVQQLHPSDFDKIVRTHEDVVVDLGTGDGKFSYDYAKEHPDSFLIGIDASAASMKEVSRKVMRRPDPPAGRQGKSGLRNIIFLQSSLENLPPELSAIADALYINFPWGSLLLAVATGSNELSKAISLLKRGGKMIIHLSYDKRFEPETVRELGLPELSDHYLKESLSDQYGKLGLNVESITLLTEGEKSSITSSWYKRLSHSREREVYRITSHLL